MLAEDVLDYMVVSGLVILNGSVLVQAGGLVVFGVLVVVFGITA